MYSNSHCSTRALDCRSQSASASQQTAWQIFLEMSCKVDFSRLSHSVVNFALLTALFFSFNLLPSAAWAGYTHKLTGCFINIDSTPAVGVNVEVNGLTTTTASNGCYTLEGIPEGTFAVNISGGDYKSRAAMTLNFAQGAAANSPTRYAIKSNNSYRVQLRVLNRATSQPMNDANVVIAGSNVTSQVNGYYTADLSTTTGAMSATKAGFTGWTGNFSVNDDSPIYRLDTYITEGGYKITGSLVDINGAGVAGAELTLSNGLSASSGTDGSFTFSGISTDTYNLTITAKKSGYKDISRGGYYVNSYTSVYRTYLKSLTLSKTGL